MATSFKISGLPVKARLYIPETWEIKAAKEKENDVVLRSQRKGCGQWRSINIWAVREPFLAISRWQEAKRFFGKFGPFTTAQPLSLPPLREETSEVNFTTVEKYQEWFRYFIQQDSPQWLSSKNFDLRTDDGVEGFARTAALGYHSPTFTVEMGHALIGGKKVPAPYLDLKAKDVFEAVYASIYIDKMRGLRGAVCQREGCSKTFLAGDPRKRFCSDTCSAYVRVTGKRTASRGIADVEAQG